jgi:hypothetical protein
MNATRIQIPLSLPEPHFEDESTVVTARQVVPLDQARSNDRRRKLIAILPFLLAATFCGALGAFAVNYFERRSTVSTASQPSSNGGSREQTSVQGPSTGDKTATSAESSEQPVGSAETSGSVNVSDSPAAESPDQNDNSDQALESARKPSSPPDPKQLVRPRRVRPSTGQPPAIQNDPPKSRGASRIQDIFSGPNP